MGRITVNGQAVQFGAKVEVTPEIWDTKAGKAVGRTQEVIELNAIFDSIKATMTKIYRELRERESSVTPDRIKNIFFGVELKQQMLLEMFKKHNEDVAKLVAKNRQQIMVDFLRHYFREKNAPEWSEFLEKYLLKIANVNDLQ